MPPIDTPLFFFGCGNMGTAIIAGAASAGALDPTRVVAFSPGVERREELVRLGVGRSSDIEAALRSFHDLEDQAATAGQVVLGIKPQVLPDVRDQLGAVVAGRRRVVITMLAGVTSGTVRDVCISGGATAEKVGVVRVMPNTPASIRRGMSAIAMGDGAVDGDLSVSEQLFASLGELLSIDESMMDAFTGVAGSGPAYVFLFAESMARAAQDIGFNEHEAALLARQTLTGAAMLLAQSGETPEALRTKVTSKKGTTAAGVEALESAGFRDAIASAVRAARDRGAALSEIAKGG